ncbi:AbrB/MazE/SpoVT family DNA-binding domain-containing protein [Candidatus Nitrososphaera sp. FF02]|uniref:AbrB/MazE/SpoVT family DNA-binding domain-containing protein n=1 Tax=Candidatus Nitrososphaera sp. FF02 TaxID=3398226 RepID=UPI0039EC89C4
MARKSTVMRVRADTPSARTTIPEDIVKELDLQIGDVLDWSVVEDKGKKYAKFRKLE